MARKPSETVKLNLRFSEELRRKLEKAAHKNNKSMNLEIVARLEKSFAAETSANWDSFLQIFLGGGDKAELLRSLAIKMQTDDQIVDEIKGTMGKGQ